MRTRIHPTTETPEHALGAIVAADVPGADGHDVIKKGERIGAEHIALLRTVKTPIHLIDVDPGELEQDLVASRLAAAVAGAGARAEPAAQGQARVQATMRGRLSVRAEAVAAINRLHPLLLFTLANGRVVAEGDDLAGAKSASLATPEALLEEAERIAAAAPIISVAPFAMRRIAVVVTDRLEPRGRALVHDAIKRKIEWLGSQMVSFAEVAHESDAVMEAYGQALAAGADLILASGGSPLDPMDPVLSSLERSGGQVQRTGVPAHPGSMVWVGALSAAPVLGIATCAGFGKDTALDLLLVRVLSGEAPDAAADALGAGGLAEGPAPGSPFPAYPRER